MKLISTENYYNKKIYSHLKVFKFKITIEDYYSPYQYNNPRIFYSLFILKVLEFFFMS